MTDLGRIDTGRVLSASSLTPDEWRDIVNARASGYRDLHCPNCQTKLYPRHRPTGQQEFAHWPTEASESCPEARKESTTHQEMKAVLALAGEQIGLRAEPEHRVGKRTVDVALFVPERTASFGPVMCLEAQNSPISRDEWADRDANHWAALNGLEPRPDGSRRVAMWVFNHESSALTGEAYVICDREDFSTIIGGVTALRDPEGPSLVASAKRVLADSQAGNIVRLEIGHGVHRWVARHGYDAPKTGKRLRQPKRSEADPRYCERPAPPERTYGWAQDRCPHCGNPSILRGGHKVCLDRWDPPS